MKKGMHMSIFDSNILDNANDFLNKGANKVSSAFDSASNKVKLAEQKRKRTEACAALGAAVFEGSKEDAAFRAKYEEKIAAVEQINGVIAEIEAQIAAAEEARAAAAAAKKKVCESCGAPLAADAKFCGNCGTKVPEPAPVPEPEPEVVPDSEPAAATSAAEEATVQLVCPACGKEVPAHADFCPLCGAKL